MYDKHRRQSISAGSVPLGADLLAQAFDSSIQSRKLSGESRNEKVKRSTTVETQSRPFLNTPPPPPPPPPKNIQNVQKVENPMMVSTVGEATRRASISSMERRKSINDKASASHLLSLLSSVENNKETKKNGKHQKAKTRKSFFFKIKDL